MIRIKIMGLIPVGFRKYKRSYSRSSKRQLSIGVDMAMFAI